MAEGGFPPFVLEVVSPESRTRDTGATDGKVRLYAVLGLTLIAEGPLLRLEDAQGQRLPTADEVRERAKQERAQALQAQATADRERARAEAAEAELARLRTGL